VLRMVVKCGHAAENPAHGVDLPSLRTVRPKWVLTVQLAAPLGSGALPSIRAPDIDFAPATIQVCTKTLRSLN